MKQKWLVICLFLIASYSGIAQEMNSSFLKVFHLMEQKNYFKASEVYPGVKDSIPVLYQLYTEACLANAFNKLQLSDEKINQVQLQGTSLPDSMVYKLLQVSQDNALKSYQYKKAKTIVETILNRYSANLSPYKIDDLTNDLNIYTALENTPPQKIEIKATSNITMHKDAAGLNNLKVWTTKDTLDFIFDTGANFSTTSLTVAKQLGMQIIPSQIKVMSITGNQIAAQMAVCPQLNLGNISIYNAVFLVFPDEALAFPQINYQINGILGFPVIEAFKEVQITTNGHLIIPEKETEFTGTSNLAIANLTPLLYCNHQHYSFDTGADSTMLYYKFYNENKEEIDSTYTPAKITFGGAGGTTQLNGYVIDHTFTIGNKTVTVKNVHVLTEKIKQTETVYGNIGQDVIRQFDKMTLNFTSMFIRFE